MIVVPLSKVKVFAMWTQVFKWSCDTERTNLWSSPQSKEKYNTDELWLVFEKEQEKLQGAE